MDDVDMDNIVPAKSPNLPVASGAYDIGYQNQFNNALRLYFNQLDANTQQIIVGVNSVTTLQWMGSD
jgi:hypothetical protein